MCALEPTYWTNFSSVEKSTVIPVFPNELQGTARIADKRGSSDVNVCTFWCKKLRILWDLWCPHGQGRLSQADIFRIRGQFFAILGGRLLWAAPNNNVKILHKLLKLLSPTQNKNKH